jgi:Ca2+-binding EF-hand superfamily protein
MRKILFAAAGFAALAGAAGLAVAQDQQEQRPRGVFAMDANSDGTLTRQEFDAGRAASFARLDSNSDGQLTREEMRAQRGERGQRRGGHRGMHHLASADANNDGNITREEFLARPNAMFDRMDANDDGVIAASERPQRRERAEGERRERPNFDANNDRQISRAEWDAMGAAQFQRLDANSDGRVTQEEAQARRGQSRGGAG